MAKEEMFGIFPIKGLRIERGQSVSKMFAREWTFISSLDVSELDEAIGDEKGFKGNLQLVQKRLDPSALLVVRRYVDPDRISRSWPELVELAEKTVAGVNLIILAFIPSAVAGSDRDAKRRELPTPIWLPTIAEHCELPILFDRNKLRMVGHSSQLNWTERERIEGHPISNEILDDVIENSPTFMKQLIKKGAPKSIENAARAIVRCLNCTSVGQFTAQCLGGLDILFGENGRSRWDVMQAYTSVLCGPETRENIRRLFEIRHNFVHRHVEPQDKAAHIKALAVTVTAIALFAQLSDAYHEGSARLHVLKACDHLRKAYDGSRIGEVRESLCKLLPVGDPPSWARDWMLTEVYQEPSSR